MRGETAGIVACALVLLIAAAVLTATSVSAFEHQPSPPWSEPITSPPVDEISEEAWDGWEHQDLKGLDPWGDSESRAMDSGEMRYLVFGWGEEESANGEPSYPVPGWEEPEEDLRTKLEKCLAEILKLFDARSRKALASELRETFYLHVPEVKETLSLRGPEESWVMQVESWLHRKLTEAERFKVEVLERECPPEPSPDREEAVLFMPGHRPRTDEQDKRWLRAVGLWWDEDEVPTDTSLQRYLQAIDSFEGLGETDKTRLRGHLRRWAESHPGFLPN
ncbi:MAG: hypothetical protein JSW37_06265 [Anaerolineales bacterium]|nr:MAG: hypothetical protein JSW37_06265 [Anaerolineales bacterium]